MKNHCLFNAIDNTKNNLRSTNNSSIRAPSMAYQDEQRKRGRMRTAKCRSVASNSMADVGRLESAVRANCGEKIIPC